MIQKIEEKKEQNINEEEEHTYFSKNESIFQQ